MMSTTGRERTTAIFRDPRFLDHITEDGHPERPDRLTVINEMLDVCPFSENLLFIQPRKVSRNDLIRVHAPRYVDKIAATAKYDFCRLTPDTTTSSGSYLAALLAAGGTIDAVEAVYNGTADNAFVLGRPPSHHAENSKALGYCLFNSIAVGAAYAIQKLGCSRVLIVDWDLHHGNGTQHIFEADDAVLFFSIHQYPLFPGTGLFTDVGLRQGEGYTFNIPLSRGYGDGEYVFLFEKILRPLALEFSPDIILVSAGFDTHRADPLGGMNLSRYGYAGLTRSLLSIADSCCDGRVVFCLEGGYHLEGLQRGVQAVLSEMTGYNRSPLKIDPKSLDTKKANYALKRCIRVHRGFWKCFREAAYE